MHNSASRLHTTELRLETIMMVNFVIWFFPQFLKNMPKKAAQTLVMEVFGPGGIAVHPRGLGRLGEGGLELAWERRVKPASTK